MKASHLEWLFSTCPAWSCPGLFWVCAVAPWGLQLCWAHPRQQQIPARGPQGPVWSASHRVTPHCGEDPTVLNHHLSNRNWLVLEGKNEVIKHTFEAQSIKNSQESAHKMFFYQLLTTLNDLKRVFLLNGTAAPFSALRWSSAFCSFLCLW